MRVLYRDSETKALCVTKINDASYERNIYNDSRNMEGFLLYTNDDNVTLCIEGLSKARCDDLVLELYQNGGVDMRCYDVTYL